MQDLRVHPVNEQVVRTNRGLGVSSREKSFGQRPRFGHVRGPRKLARPMNKMRRFLEKVAHENSGFHAAVKGAKKRIEMAQKVGKTYNKFAQWLALPQVPDLFLGKSA